MEEVPAEERDGVDTLERAGAETLERVEVVTLEREGVDIVVRGVDDTALERVLTLTLPTGRLTVVVVLRLTLIAPEPLGVLVGWLMTVVPPLRLTVVGVVATVPRLLGVTFSK